MKYTEDTAVQRLLANGALPMFKLHGKKKKALALTRPLGLKLLDARTFLEARGWVITEEY